LLKGKGGQDIIQENAVGKAPHKNQPRCLWGGGDKEKDGLGGTEGHTD